ncbi:hypothetical protein J6Y73_01635 [bacterium]|nr:hypothetical protein [bacterium]
MFERRDLKKKKIDKNPSNLSLEEKRKLEFEGAKKELEYMKKELDNNPEAKEMLKTLGEIFKGIKSSETDEKEDTNILNQFGKISGASAEQISQDYNSVLDKIRNIEKYEKKYVVNYEPKDYEFDFDPKIISYLISLDGAGYKDYRNSGTIDEKTNPTSVKQWTNLNNPFLKNETLKRFYYKYFEIDEEDEKRINFIEEVV